MTMINTTSLASSAQKSSHRAKGEPLAMRLESSCSRLDCSKQVVTSFEERDFCFDHFCDRCYELLERSDRSGVLAVSSQEFHDEMLALDECAKRALEISFSQLPLNNLDRARLLDILLWAGDLTSALPRRRMAPPELLETKDK